MNLFYCFCFALIHYICLNLTFSVLKKKEFQTPVVVVHSLSRVQLFVPPWTAACQASLFTISQSWLKLMSIESAIPSNHLFLCRPPLLLPSVFSRIRVFTDESALWIRWPKYWSFSFTISLYSEYSGLISKGLSRVFSNTIVQKHQFFGAQPSFWSNSCIHTWLRENP